MSTPVFMSVAAVLAVALGASAAEVPNGGFEAVDEATGFAAGWVRGLGPGTEGAAELDSKIVHSGSHSLRISDATPFAAFKYVLVNSQWLDVASDTTYVVRFWARGRDVRKCFVGAGFEGAGEHQEQLPVGDYGWRELSFRFTVPAGCARVSIRFLADGLADGLWIDDVRLDVSEVQLANIPEVREPWPYPGWFPRTPGPMPDQLTVLDISNESRDVRGLMIALQGLVNRDGPRLYLINATNPRDYDRMWLDYMRQKGYVHEAEHLGTWQGTLKRFRDAVRGVIVWDPELPGSQNAAWMLAGLEDALPVSPEMAADLRLPIVDDLRGRWQRNVDAYRYVYEKHWPEMCHHLLAWEYPRSNALTSRDTMVQHKVFMFWVSAYGDEEPGADPTAEMQFVEEILAHTPGNVPVMGWPMYNTLGVAEYTAVRLLSEYGKWVPGTGYSSNVSVHSAIVPPADVFRRRCHMDAPRTAAPRPDKVYISIDILDSGDAHWYWQFHQRKIWADPARGSVPTGYGMNATLLDTLPLVAQWYYENMTPNDDFFALLYMNAPVYASRFRKEDRERIWGKFVTWMDRYRRRLDMDGIEVYSGGSGGPSVPDALLRRFTRGMPGLRYILADLGRHVTTRPDEADCMVDDTVVFHTLTRFRIWTTSEELWARTMEAENAWLTDEIAANTPSRRPAFMSAMAVSWHYFPAWLKDLQMRLPAEYEAVIPDELARLYRARNHEIRTDAK